MQKQYFVYILTTKKNTTLYIGVTSDLQKRVYEHKAGLVNGFTKTCSVNKLVYVEIYSDINEAIRREKCGKRWKRDWKINLIEKENPEWADLYDQEFKIPDPCLRRDDILG